jgi:hypothetical protein
MTIKEQWFSVFYVAYWQLVGDFNAPKRSRIELWELFSDYYRANERYTDKKLRDAALFVAHGGKLSARHNRIGFGWLRRPTSPIMWGTSESDGLTRRWADNFTNPWPMVMLWALAGVMAWYVFGA